MVHRYIQSSNADTYLEDSRGGELIKAVNKFEFLKNDPDEGLPRRKAKVEVLFEIKTGKITVIKDGQAVYNERGELK